MTSAMATDDSVSQQPESRDPVVVTADGVMNRGAYQAVLVLFITFAIILNAFIAGIVVRIFVTKPKVRMRSSTKLTVILVCCVVQFIAAVYPYPLSLHLMIRDSGIPLPCSQPFAATVGFCILDSLTILLVATLTMAEAVKKGVLLKLNRKTQFLFTVALLVLSALYVSILELPVLLQVWLDNLNDPCVEFFGVTVLNVSADPDKIRALPAVKYLIPALVLVSAHVLLILSDFMRPRSSKPGGANASAGKSTTDEAEVDFSSELSARLGVGVTPHHSQTPSVGTTHNEHSARIRKLLQTVDVRLAGLLVFVLYLPEFILMMAYAEDAPEPDPDVTVQHVRLEAASELLKVLLLVLVPCCWWLDKDIRRLVCCCVGGGRRARGERVTQLVRKFNREAEERF